MFIRTQDKGLVINTELVSNIYVNPGHTKIYAESDNGLVFDLGDYPKKNAMDALERLLNAISEDRRYYEM